MQRGDVTETATTCMSITAEFDKVADALAAQTRREILVELTEHGSVAKGGIEADGASEIELTHRYLPKLDEMGYISWERGCGTITKGSDWEEIESVVQLLTENPIRIP